MPSYPCRAESTEHSRAEARTPGWGEKGSAPSKNPAAHVMFKVSTYCMLTLRSQES